MGFVALFDLVLWSLVVLLVLVVFVARVLYLFVTLFMLLLWFYALISCAFWFAIKFGLGFLGMLVYLVCWLLGLLFGLLLFWFVLIGGCLSIVGLLCEGSEPCCFWGLYVLVWLLR